MGTHRTKCKYCECFLEYINLSDLQEELPSKAWKKVKEKVFNTFKSANHDNNKFILLLRKRCLSLLIYRRLGKSNWNIITWKRRFLKSLDDYMEDVTDVDYAHAKRPCKDFEMKNVGEFYDLHVQSITVLLGDVF